jgi:hypothetical protein
MSMQAARAREEESVFMLRLKQSSGRSKVHEQDRLQSTMGPHCGLAKGDALAQQSAAWVVDQSLITRTDQASLLTGLHSRSATTQIPTTEQGGAGCVRLRSCSAQEDDASLLLASLPLRAAAARRWMVA